MTRRLQIRGTVLTDAGWQPHASVIVENRRIVAVEAAVSTGAAGSAWDFEEAWIIPGLVDVHVHGGGGGDFTDGTLESTLTAAGFHARFGTTGLLATTVTAELEALAQAIGVSQQAAVAQKRGEAPGARILGVHLEGPFLNPVQKGAQRHDLMRTPDPAIAERLLQQCPGVVRWMTLAPELPGAPEVMRLLARAGVVVAAGHSDASYSQMQTALGHGLRHVTHLFNAMSGLHHRQPGVVGAALSLPGLTAEVIADTEHVHPAALRLAWQALGWENLCLITDAIRAAGLRPGRYDVGGLSAEVADGSARLDDGTLAGSVLTMNRALQVMVEKAGVPLQEAVRMASWTPARLLGLTARKGRIKAGYDADLVVLDRSFTVCLTLVEGEPVYRA